MKRLARVFGQVWPTGHRASWADAGVLLGVAVLTYLGAEMAIRSPQTVSGPEISLEPARLPSYAALSMARMAAAYLLSLLFTLVYGYIAARNRRARAVMMPLLDVLQSVPILSFLPVVLLSLAAVIPENAAAELASVVLIFTSQVWNMTFGWYQSLTTIPKELREAGSIFRFNGWLRLRHVELPFAAIGLVWNSMMSWAGGWFFVMAAEMFRVGDRDFRLAGIGSYLQTAANEGDVRAIFWGLGTLIALIVGLDQLVWRPLLAWSERFKLQMMSEEFEAKSWFYDAVNKSALAQVMRGAMGRLLACIDGWSIRHLPVRGDRDEANGMSVAEMVGVAGLVGGLAYGGYRAALMLRGVSAPDWADVGVGLAATSARVAVALAIALLWTVPLGVALGSNRRLANWLQPLVQIAASIPATALFPVLLLVLLGLPGGLNIAAVLLMLTGTQWYLLFNVVAGASAIPQDLKHTASLLGLSRWERWRTLTLPALFPYIITGSITAGGGAWNASIVAEYAEFGGRTVFTAGIGSLIARSTAAGNFPLLLASTLTMVGAVVMINRLVWRRLYRLAAERYTME